MATKKKTSGISKKPHLTPVEQAKLVKTRAKKKLAPPPSEPTAAQRTAEQARAKLETKPIATKGAVPRTKPSAVSQAVAKSIPIEGAQAARPFVKWAGGKGKAVDLLKSFLPAKIREYHEPMVGGGALFFALAADRRFALAHLNDTNAELIWTYVAIREHVDELIAYLHTLRYNKRTFAKLRALDPTQLSMVERAGRMIYLNKTCFNGLYRVNKSGQFNVPFGRYDHPLICDEPNLRAVHRALTGPTPLRYVRLTMEDYRYHYGVDRTYVQPGDALYFDSPYVPLSKTANFTAYGPGAFGPTEHEQLAEVFARLAKRRIAVMLSNSDTPFTRKLYKGFTIRTVKARRNINTDATKRGEVREIVVLANCRT